MKKDIKPAKNPPPQQDEPLDTSRAPMTNQRRSQIADLVRDRGSMRVIELAELFDVSEVTIRNDLVQLEKDGELVRDRGGAVPGVAPRQITSLLAVEQRSHLQPDQKRRVARAAAALVKPGDTIIMDAGTTVVEMVPYLADITPLTVVTNALNVVLEVASKTDARIIVLGGTFSREASSTIGSIAERMLGDLVVQKAFLGTQAFDIENGLTDTTLEIAEVKRAMIRAARRTVLLTDSTKLGRSGFIKVAPLTAMHTIICDEALPVEVRSALEQLGVEVTIA
ncbi:MAG: DeoR/GlpR family DNA-binding transcription regulator [Chthoniobacter sp.]